MIEKVRKFRETIGVVKDDIDAIMDKCSEENEELLLAYVPFDQDAMLKETADRIITGYALLDKLGGTEQTVIDKMAEVMARPEYQGVRG